MFAGIANIHEEFVSEAFGILQVDGVVLGLLHHDIGDLYLVAGTLVKNQRTLQAAVEALPKGAAAFTRGLGYGSWLNGYICSIGVQSGKLIVPVKVGGTTLHSAVCPG